MNLPRDPATVASFGRVVVVASLGGIQAITAVLSGLPATYPIPIAVVQHRRRTGARDLLVPILARRTKLPTRVAESGCAADQFGITVVPGQTVATIDNAGRWVLNDAVAGAAPGNELLVSSARTTPTVAVILTGALGDGADGCRAVKRSGGRVLVQDPATAQAGSMPANAIATGCADFVLPLDRLASALLALTTAPGAAELLAVPLPPWARLTS
ncbi:chemotaxis protein CheB [Candidatus Mycobacterium methanotrophicum]|uniref:Chemotaxis protein CheB n=1 Tax=Candidatus Mycobacterium methanotrophicum TaxID=2943498 RepID=A0ABY4QM94_9MYCO|nr:chemotaxis protein CheB [Candidatus Mycobacterium methanotrophicum]UQX12103.1 chemotaxis protein CheB [Candidatus Mycobacterium methanotrophicum]